jgi:hypothetical protein
MDETWLSRDLPVLDAVVELLEDQPMAKPAAIAERTGFEAAEVVRALRALDGEYVHLNTDLGGRSAAAVTPKARQAVGHWPSGESLIQQLVDGLVSAAEKEADPERKGRLHQAAALLGGAARDIAVGVAQAYADRRLGIG